ncbi:hypothetical protein [Dyadobacter sp. 676]|uniref:YkgJ family cysteine cluster protein n=1 Tax=Dyadobacter sp. 676 TaxID=3088362 RepID=A0AAU8FRU3_9BACT
MTVWIFPGSRLRSGFDLCEAGAFAKFLRLRPMLLSLSFTHLTSIKMTDREKDVSGLCVACGLCCDGTLFPYGFVRDEADKKIADDLGLSTTEIKGTRLFSLPCLHFSGCCSVYDKPRPHTCSAFFCPPIKKYRRGEQTFEEAEKQVKLFKEHRDKLLKIASQFQELAGLSFKALKDLLEESADDDAFVGRYRQLYLMLFIYRDIYSKYFQPAQQDKLIV